MLRRRWLVLAALLWLAHQPAVAASPALAVDVHLTPRGDGFIDKSRPSFDPDGPAGWKMTDRFRGLRFEIADISTESSSIESVMETTASMAHELRCFGWIQAVGEDAAAAVRLVGEARCPKTAAERFTIHLQSLGHAELLAYPNTKIRYHFPRFRVLHEPRYLGKTCFASAPHTCKP